VVVFPQTVQQVKRWLKIVSGFTLLAVGVVMLVTPGPGWPVILAGLALLAAEYVWARRLLQRVKDGGTRLRNAVMPSRARRSKELETATLKSRSEPQLDSQSDLQLDVPLDAQLEPTPEEAPTTVKD
jgi:uncharacterized protein (TIGR02611 family)